MGVDCTLYVLADYGPYAVATFKLNRDCELFPTLERAAKSLGGGFQLPNGAFCAMSNGSRPAECEDRELGWLFKDSYGAPIRYILGGDLPARDDDGLNARVISFIRANYPDHKVVVFLH